MTLVKNTNPRQAARILKDIARDPSDTEVETFTLTSHIEEGLNPSQQRTRILNYFSAVSQEYTPLKRELLDTKVKKLLKDSKPPKDIPFTDEISIMEALRKTKITMSHVPGDLPPALRSEFFQWLTEPFKNIIIEIVTSGEWPMAWKVEYGTPIVKETQPVVSEESLRVISIINKLSMCAK